MIIIKLREICGVLELLCHLLSCCKLQTGATEMVGTQICGVLELLLLLHWTFLFSSTLYIHVTRYTKYLYFFILVDEL
jgi:hypothetical protein